MVKQLMRLNASDFALCGGVMGGVFLLLQIVVAAVMTWGKPEESIYFSGTLLPIMAGILILGVSVAQVGVTFEHALRFGQTRKRALVLALGLMGVEALYSMGLAALLTMVERVSCAHLWGLLSGRGAQLRVDDIFIGWVWFPLIAVVAAAMGLIAGTILLRFGAKGMWSLWGIWMAGCFLPQLLPWKQYTIVDWLFPLAGIAVLVGVFWSVYSLLRLAVKE